MMCNPCDSCTLTIVKCNQCMHCNIEDFEPLSKRHKEYLAHQIHHAEQIVWWISYQPEMSDCEKHQLKRMAAFLESLRKRIE